MIPPEIHREITRRLEEAAGEHGVRILLAVESGSRAWGFASPNSDYDVRFIYARPAEWYLSVDLEERRDVIEYPIVDDIDLNGWDLRKALRLFWRSNPAFVEWIQSPIRYMENGDFAKKARAALPQVYRRDSGFHHYGSMARSNYRGYLRAEQVRLKKYFYVLRPLLAVRWIERYDTPPPIEFRKLLHLLEGQRELLDDIESLLARKQAAPELGLAAPVPRIDQFIESELARIEQLAPAASRPDSTVDLLNELFRATLSEPASPRPTQEAKR